MSHIILLVQPTKRPESRTYANYESVDDCMESICKMFEADLKSSHPKGHAITYDISHLYDFLDGLTYLSCLVHRPDTHTFQLHSRDWVKPRIYALLRRQPWLLGKPQGRRAAS